MVSVELPSSSRLAPLNSRVGLVQAYSCASCTLTRLPYSYRPLSAAYSDNGLGLTASDLFGPADVFSGRRRRGRQ